MEDSNLKVRPSVVQQLVRKGPRHEPEVEEARDSFQSARANSRESVMLDVYLADGSVESFPYHLLTRVKYLPEDTLVLRFGGDEVHVEGRNLSRLRETISEHRARFIQEGTESEQGLKPEDAAHISRIVIVEGNDL